MNMKCLIVNADDYGYTPGVSAGIRTAHLTGIITSTTTMMNSLFIEQELQELINVCPTIGIGVHLVMTTGKPVLPVENLPVLMKLSDDGQSFKHDLDKYVDQINLAEIRSEWRAQIEKFIRLTKRIPDHLDAHHQAMCFHDGLFEIYMQLAEYYHCAIRRPPEEFLGPWLVKSLKTSLEKESEKKGVSLWDEVPKPDMTDTRFYDGDVSDLMLNQMINELGNGLTEWMCHPGVVDETLMTRSSYNLLRGEELKLLTQPDLQKRLTQNNVTLVSYSVLSDQQRVEGGVTI